MILAPVWLDSAQRLVVIADGALQYVPVFSVAHSGSNRRPLILDHELVSLPSASSLAVHRQALAQRKPAPKILAVIAGSRIFGSDSRFRPPKVNIQHDS